MAIKGKWTHHQTSWVLGSGMEEKNPGYSKKKNSRIIDADCPDDYGINPMYESVTL